MSIVQDFGDGIRVFSAKPGSSNLSVIGHHGALLIDAGSLPSAATRFWKSVTDLVDAQLVLTHHHADHVFGASGLDGVPLIASGTTARLLGELGAAERDRLIEMLPDHDVELKGAQVPVVTHRLDAATGIRAGDREVRIIPVGHAHTPGDVVAFDTQTRTLFTGDVVFTNVMPVLRDANVPGWLDALDLLARLEPVRVIPGHGTAGGIDVLTDMMELLAALRAIAEHHAGEADPTVSVDELPTRFRGLQRMERLTPGIRAILRELGHINPTPLSPRRSES